MLLERPAVDPKKHPKKHMSESNSWEAITSTANYSDGNSTSTDALGDVDANGSAELPPLRSEAVAAVNEEASWFGMGGLGIAALSLAQGVPIAPFIKLR